MIASAYLKPGDLGMATDFTPPGCKFGMQIAEDVNSYEACDKAARILRQPTERLVLMPGHFVPFAISGAPPWYYRSRGWRVYVRLEDF